MPATKGIEIKRAERPLQDPIAEKKQQRLEDVAAGKLETPLVIHCYECGKADGTFHASNEDCKRAATNPFARMDESRPVAKRIEVIRKGRHYEIPTTGEHFPSVTNILNATPKPALVHWAANKERELCIEAAANLYEDAPVNVKMSRPGYISTLKERLGKQKAHRKELDKAAEIGSKVHERIEWGLRKELLDKASEIGEKRKMPPEPVLQGKALWAFMAWEDWRKTVDLEPIWIEQVVWSAKHRYAGTLDLYAEFQITDKLLDSLDDEECKKIQDYRGTRQRCVCDWKTGSRLYDEATLQNAAYVSALIEMGHAEMGCWGLLIRLPKTENDPEFEARFVLPEEISEAMQVFMHVQKVWEWKNA